MTIEKRTLIEIKDIVAFEYECSHCHARHSVPLEKLDRLAYECQNCREKWLEIAAGSNREDEAVSKLVASIKSLRDRKTGAVLRLEISGLE